MKLDELQDKIRKIRELGRETDREIQRKNEIEGSELSEVYAEILGIYVSMPKSQAISMINSHILKRAEDYKRLCKEIGVEP